MSLERITWVSPAYDKRDAAPAKNHGIGACRITFIVKGPKGAVQFLVGTNWYCDSAREHRSRFRPLLHDEVIMGCDVGYHSPVPRYEGQEPMAQPCNLVDGGTCYYDGSSLRADSWVKKLIICGTAWLWPHLEGVYRHEFEGGPEVTP